MLHTARAPVQSAAASSAVGARQRSGPRSSQAVPAAQQPSFLQGRSRRRCIAASAAAGSPPDSSHPASRQHQQQQHTWSLLERSAAVVVQRQVDRGSRRLLERSAAVVVQRQVDRGSRRLQQPAAASLLKAPAAAAAADSAGGATRTASRSLGSSSWDEVLRTINDDDDAAVQQQLLLGDTYPATPGGQQALQRAPAQQQQQSYDAPQPQQQQQPLPQQEQEPLPSPQRSLSSGSFDDSGDWLTVVLSAPASRLTANSNAVLTNSLRRLASLRYPTASGALGGMDAAASDAVGGPEGLLDSIKQRFGTLSLLEFEEVAMQLAKLGCQPGEAWLQAFDRFSLQTMPRGSPRLLSKLLLARAKLCGASVGSAWCAACLAHMAAAPDRLSMSSWTNALWACVRLGHEPNRQFQATFFSTSAERLDDVSPELLTQLVWSLARLRLAPTVIWWHRLVDAAATIEKPFTSSQLASLLHSLALWARPGPGGHRLADVQALVVLLLSQLDRELGLLQPAELTSMLAALAELAAGGKLVLPLRLQDGLLSAVQGQLPRLNHAQLTQLCCALGRLGAGKGPASSAAGFSEALLLEVAAQLSGLSSTQLVNVMWALARMGLSAGHCSTPFRQRLWEELQHRCSSTSSGSSSSGSGSSSSSGGGGLDSSELPTLLWSLAQLQLVPPQPLLHDLCVLAEAALPATSDASQLTNIVWGLGRLGARPSPAWLDAAETASLHSLPSAGLTQLVNLCWGMAQLHRASSRSSSRSSAVAPPASSPSLTWQTAVLRELRLRCLCAGLDDQDGGAPDCVQLVGMLEELGVQGMNVAAAAAADALFDDEDDAGDEAGYCSVQFQPGCR